ncbi:MAG: amidoligase family protein [Aeromonas popoffii]|uniref:amidoligase family protein n=1 Tax=Aeromonas popoffii TaxID=70856 RepID=UPI003F40FD07
MKVAQYFGHNFQRVSLLRHPMVLGTQCVGVEVELENVADWDMNSDYWVIKEDGSLRNNGREFVFRGPTGGKDLYNALVELDTFLTERNPDGNWRCSTHMHLDVRDMNVKQLKLMILAYVAAEKALFRLSAMHRYTNNFCAAIGFAQDQLQILSNAWSSTDIGEFWNKLQGWNKYSALNLLPMHNFGSVEFRMSDAKWKKNDLLLLCNRFLALKEMALHWEGTEEELVAFIINSPIHEVFPKGIPVDMPADFLVEDLAVGHKLAFDLLTFQAVEANIIREPVVMPEVRGGNGQWNEPTDEAHNQVVQFMVRAGVGARTITDVIFGAGAENEDGEPNVLPFMKINSHIINRHFWSLYLQSLGHRIPADAEVPKFLPTGVIKQLVQQQYHHVVGLLQRDVINHLLTEDQRNNMDNNDAPRFHDEVQEPVRAPVRPVRARAGNPARELNIQAAGRAVGQRDGAAAHQWFVEDNVPNLFGHGIVEELQQMEQPQVVRAHDELDEFGEAPDQDGPF